ncbi:MAG: acetyl-CoA hydrolase [Pseudomonadaceae bacterium]|nr:acetyl-CoA hydrolase [Pseudomonadaceae bacterium]
MQQITSEILDGWLSDGAQIFVAGSSNEPVELVNVIGSIVADRHLHFFQFPLAGFNTTDFTALGPNVELTTVFMTPALRSAVSQRLHFLPMQMRAMNDFCRHKAFDLVLIQGCYDAAGDLRLGPNADFAEAAMSRADKVLVEINSALVPAAGAPHLNSEKLAGFVTSERAAHEPAAVVIDETARAIAKNVAGIVRDGDCLQTGIGGIPAAILDALSDHNDLGMHGGLIDDGGRLLIEKGVINGARKSIDRGRHITGMALGSPALHTWLAQREDVVFKGADYTHEFSVLQQIENFVSINSAVEVDLQGQVNAEVVGGRQISGTGGSLDFMRGARASKGGRSIVAMTATARRGEVSRIVQRVEHVTAARTDIDLVVTEYGVADLRYASLDERRELLINVAAPNFRDQLQIQ